MADAVRYAEHELRADQGAEYDGFLEIDLSTLEPLINGPFTPDLTTPISRFGTEVKAQDWPSKLSAGLIGSCTNSSFEDMTRAASLGQQALAAGLKPKMPLLVSPGSEQTRATLEKAGVLEVFEKLGSTLLTNACGPCCGSWDRQDMKKVSHCPRKQRISTTDILRAQRTLSSHHITATSQAVLTRIRTPISSSRRPRLSWARSSLRI